MNLQVSDFTIPVIVLNLPDLAHPMIVLYLPVIVLHLPNYALPVIVLYVPGFAPCDSSTTTWFCPPFDSSTYTSFCSIYMI